MDRFAQSIVRLGIAFLEFFYLLIWPPLFYQKHTKNRQMATVIGFWLWLVIFFIIEVNFKVFFGHLTPNDHPWRAFDCFYLIFQIPIVVLLFIGTLMGLIRWGLSFSNLTLPNQDFFVLATAPFFFSTIFCNLATNALYTSNQYTNYFFILEPLIRLVSPIYNVLLLWIGIKILCQIRWKEAMLSATFATIFLGILFCCNLVNFLSVNLELSKAKSDPELERYYNLHCHIDSTWCNSH